MRLNSINYINMEHNFMRITADSPVTDRLEYMVSLLKAAESEFIYITPDLISVMLDIAYDDESGEVNKLISELLGRDIKVTDSVLKDSEELQNQIAYEINQYISVLGPECTDHFNTIIAWLITFYGDRYLPVDLDEFRSTKESGWSVASLIETSLSKIANKFGISESKVDYRMMIYAMCDALKHELKPLVSGLEHDYGCDPEFDEVSSLEKIGPLQVYNFNSDWEFEYNISACVDHANVGLIIESLCNLIEAISGNLDVEKIVKRTVSFYEYLAVERSN